MCTCILIIILPMYIYDYIMAMHKFIKKGHGKYQLLLVKIYKKCCIIPILILD